MNGAGAAQDTLANLVLSQHRVTHDPVRGIECAAGCDQNGGRDGEIPSVRHLRDGEPARLLPPGWRAHGAVTGPVSASGETIKVLGPACFWEGSVAMKPRRTLQCYFQPAPL